MRNRFRARTWLAAVLFLVLAQGLLTVAFFRHLGTGVGAVPMPPWIEYVAVGSACLTGLTVLVVLWLNFQISHVVMHPVVLMQRILDRAAQGALHLRLPLMRDRSLTALARSCNRLLESLQEVTEEGRRRIQGERDVASALVESFATPTLVLGAGGEVLIANQAARVLLTGPDGPEATDELTRCVAEGEGSFELTGRLYTVEATLVSHASGLAGAVVHVEVE